MPTIKIKVRERNTRYAEFTFTTPEHVPTHDELSEMLDDGEFHHILSDDSKWRPPLHNPEWNDIEGDEGWFIDSCEVLE